MTIVDKDGLNISLEEHVVNTLRPLHRLLPIELSEETAPYLSSSSPPAVIPYSLLSSISRWARSEAGIDALRAQTPPLDPQVYSMVSLLAGTKTSPERFFGKYTPPKDPADIQAERFRERKSIMAILNALLSIVGSGFAVYLATGRTGWRVEWRVLLSLFVAIIVATAEAALFLIWQSRRTRTVTAAKRRRISQVTKDRTDSLDSGKDAAAMSTSANVQISGLRQRK